MRGAWWWIDRWLQSRTRRRMTAEQRGVVRELWDYLWTTPERIVPDDDREIGIGIVSDPEAWARHREMVLSSWRHVKQGERAAPWAEPASEDGWTHDVTLEVIATSLKRAEKQRAYRERHIGNGYSNAAGNAGGSQDPSPSLSQDPSPKAGAPAPGPPRRVAARTRRTPTAAEFQRLAQDPELSAVASAYASAFGGSPGLGALRAARRAREGGYTPETCQIAIDAVRLARDAPERFPPQSHARWCAEHNRGADYVLRPGVVDRLAAEHPGDVEPFGGLKGWLEDSEPGEAK